MPKTPKPIPSGVLNLLKHVWREADEDYSSFDAVFNDLEDKERRSDPSYYHIRPGKEVDSDFDSISHADAVKLAEQRVFGALAKMHENKVVAINEHAQHALTDFCSEVYSAWKKYQQRIAEVERVSPPFED